MLEKYSLQILQVKNNFKSSLDDISMRFKNTKLSDYPFSDTTEKVFIEVFPRDFFIESDIEQQYLIWTVKSLVIASKSKIVLKQLIKDGLRRYFIICDQEAKEEILKITKIWNGAETTLPILPNRISEQIFRNFIQVINEKDSYEVDSICECLFVSRFPMNYLNEKLINSQYLSALYNINGDSEIDYCFELVDTNKYSNTLAIKDGTTFELSPAFAKINNSRIRNSKNKIEETSDALAKGLQVVNVSVNIKLVCSSVEELAKRSNGLKNTIRIQGGELSSYYGEQKEAFCSFDPRSKLKITKNVKIDVLLDNSVCLFPFRYVSQGDVSGVAIGTTNGSNFFFDTRRNQVKNIFALGDSGMGKSQLIKNLIRTNSNLGRYQLVIDGAMKSDGVWDFDDVIEELDNPLISTFRYDNTQITQLKADEILIQIQLFFEKCKSLRSVNPNLEFVVVIDETWALLKFPEITAKLIELSKGGRKSNFSFYGATHDLMELDENGARSLRQMFDIYFMFKTSQSEFMGKMKLVNQNEINYLSSRDIQLGDCLVKIYKLDNKTDMSYRVKLFENF